MPITVNGRALGVATNGVFTDANTDPIAGGRLWTEAALTWNAMRAAAVAAGIEPWEFVPAGPVSSARPLSAQRYFYAHRPPAAAIPGTSNHGWGIAVDVKTRRAAAWMLRSAARFGWSHDEGLRVHEWWHFAYEGAPRATIRRLRKKPDPLEGYTDSERRWIHEYDRLKRAGRDANRRAVLRRVMSAQRKRIWKLAQPRAKGGDGHGWTALRRKRYASLLARSR
jgi:hypothetical protein